MSWAEFKDLASAIQSISIAAAACAAGGWALLQFISLRQIERAKLDVEKTKEGLKKRGVLLISLKTELLQQDTTYFIHVQVQLQNVGTGFEVAEWTQAKLIAKKVEQVTDGNLKFSMKAFEGQRSPSIDVQKVRLMPGFATSEAFLIPVYEAGIYYVEFSIPCSRIASSLVAEDLALTGASVTTTDAILWKADTFVAIPERGAAAASESVMALARG